MEFYSLRHRRSVTVPDSVVRRRVISRETKAGTQERFMLEAKTTVEGVDVSLHKFVSRATFEAFEEHVS
jgi:hypothetical protein